MREKNKMGLLCEMDAFGVTGCGSVMEKCEHFSATLTLHGVRTHCVSSPYLAFRI